MERINLYYGYRETTSGIYHTFVATDIDDKIAPDVIGGELADELNCDRNDPDSGFNWDSFDIPLPEKTVGRIKQDGRSEMMLAMLGEGPWRNDSCKGYAIMAMERAGLDADTIRKVSAAMTDCFDDTTVDAAGRYYAKGAVV